jgi:hypothetical protein
MPDKTVLVSEKVSMRRLSKAIMFLSKKLSDKSYSKEAKPKEFFLF